jgi:1,4-alpha-glucan branching enzyme
MKTGTTVDYAIKRTKTHIHHVLELHRQIRNSAIDEDYLRNLELTDNLFPEIDYRSFGR